MWSREPCVLERKAKIAQRREAWRVKRAEAKRKKQAKMDQSKYTFKCCGDQERPGDHAKTREGRQDCGAPGFVEVRAGLDDTIVLLKAQGIFSAGPMYSDERDLGFEAGFLLSMVGMCFWAGLALLAIHNGRPAGQQEPVWWLCPGEAESYPRPSHCNPTRIHGQFLEEAQLCSFW